MGAQAQMYAFVTGLFGLMWPLMAIVGPFVLMRLIITFVRWSNKSARGEQDLEGLREDAEERARDLQLRRRGFSAGQTYRAREQRAGQRFRW
jgi:hypothetical protein